MKQTISVLVENQAGVLNRITGLFSRRAFNIESLAVGVTDDPTIKLPPIDVSAIPSDFKLSLDELKFGRNYGDNK